MNTPESGQTLVRWRHEDAILAVLRDHGAMRRSELAARVGISRTTLSEIVRELLGRGALRVVATDAAARRGSGRPAELIALDPSSGQYLGMDFAHAAIHLSVVDASYEVIAARHRALATDAPWEERIAAALALADEIESEGARFGALQGVGVGLPGPFSPAWSGGHSVARKASERARRAVESAVVERFGITPLLDTNTRLAALAEAVHEETADRDLVYLRFAAGVGGGVVVGGRLVHGDRGLAGELGHVSVRREGRTCRCGKRGCLETVASVPAVLESCRERGLELEDLSDLERAVERADPVLEDVLRDAGAAAGQVLAGIVLSLNPAEIVVGGALPRIAPAFVQQVASTITYEVHTIDGARPRVRASELGDSGGATGAILALAHRTSLLADYPGGRSAPAVPLLRRSCA